MRAKSSLRCSEPRLVVPLDAAGAIACALAPLRRMEAAGVSVPVLLATLPRGADRW